MVTVVTPPCLATPIEQHQKVKQMPLKLPPLTSSAAVYDMSASVYGSVNDNDNKSDMLMWWG